MSKDLVNGNKRYLRIFDANLNRCREGLRVLEDSARFVINAPAIYKKLRSFRHKLDKVTRKIYPELLNSRDSESDPGKVIKEGIREDFKAVLAANFRRVEESLRVLEEYSRLAEPPAGPVFKKIRFEIYTLEKKLLV